MVGFSWSTRARTLPHVALILADDFGHANIGYNRRGEPGSAAAEVHTPNLDLLANKGVVLTQHYTYKYCAPSRSALQSGRLPVHVNMENSIATLVNEEDPISGFVGIPKNMTTIATKLRAAGYATHAVGKWDVGMATPEHTPLGRGYESWLGYYQHANDYFTKTTSLFATGEIDNCLNDASFLNITRPSTGELFEGNGFRDLSLLNASFRGGVRNGAALANTTYEEDVFKQHALSLVGAHDPSVPLFLFYAFHLVHSPLEVPAAYLARIDELVAAGGAPPFDTDNRRLYAAMVLWMRPNSPWHASAHRGAPPSCSSSQVLYMDEAVGELVAAFEAREAMWTRTLLIFATDNGGPLYEPGAANNFPLRGGKYSDFQGGVRTNAFLSGGWLPDAARGTSFSGVVHIADWYGALCGLAGVNVTDAAAAAAGLPPVDARDFLGAALKGGGAEGGRTDALHLSADAILRWPWKLVTGPQAYGVWTTPRFPNCSVSYSATEGRLLLIPSESFSFLPIPSQVSRSATEGRGPEHSDTRVFGTPIPYGPPAVQDNLTWVHDCGYAPGCLFNVDVDPTEHHDLAQSPEHAGRAAALAAELAALNATLFTPDRGTPSLEACLRGIDEGRFCAPHAPPSELMARHDRQPSRPS